jgi:hypothetical protein
LLPAPVITADLPASLPAMVWSSFIFFCWQAAYYQVQ